MPPKKTKKTTPVDIQKLVSEAAFSAPVSAPKVKKPALPKAEKTPAAYVVIDHPAEGEIVSGLAYVMRIGASAGGHVEVSINNGDWAPCRNSAGYWWFDWGYFKPGPHTITARIVDGKGKILKKSAVRKCTVV